ncbi:MAG TPA: class I SAM-dependent methyltransferase [Candidatus Bathyarchaeia archaeon]|nr:class I SAM-dependent methyltransferase [Candidatus Bathyarchaeia archaeon]
MGRRKSTTRQLYVNIFNDMNTDWEAIANARDTEHEVDSLEDTIPKKGVVLDLCCGTGRHSIALVKRGWNVVGIDLSRNLLEIAKSKMKRVVLRFPLVRADMRFFPFREGTFSAILSMFTSFGYLPSESEDVMSLLEINRTLKKRGRFLLDLANRDHIVKSFRERDWAEFEPFYMFEKRSFDLKNSKLSSQWTIIKKHSCKVKTIQHTVRLYTPTRIKQLLNEAGLRIKDIRGGYDKQEFTLEASRMIVVAHKLA